MSCTPVSEASRRERMLSAGQQRQDLTSKVPSLAVNEWDESETSQTQTQTELLTQNEMTQLVDDDNSSLLSPPPPQSPVNLQSLPWGRLIPCSKHWTAKDRDETGGPRGFGGIDLLPRGPVPSSISGSDKADNEETIALLGLEGLKRSDIFNEYTLGRSPKCDVVAVKPTQDEISDGGRKKVVEPAIRDWAHAMISNRHCRIFCMLKPTATSGQLAHGSNVDIEVYIEDTSGNGTLINNSTLLRKGEKRILHTGDEISLINSATLRKKIRSAEILSDLQRHHSFIFVNVYQQQGLQRSMLLQQRQPQATPAGHDMPPPPRSTGRRRAAVDVRATQHHSLKHNNSSNKKRLSSLVSSADTSRRISPRRREPRRIEEEYDIRDVLGSGTCGEVRRAIHRRTGQEWAVKVIPLGGRNRGSHFSETGVATLEAEAAILQELDHPYVVKLADVFVSAGVAVYLVMELLHGGDLFDRIVQKGNYTEVESRRVMRRLLNAIYYLHDVKRIVHRDLKPENILLCNHQSDIYVKLTDFGLAKAVSEEGLKTFCGTPQYFAPEVLRRRHTVAGRGRYGKQADMWSLGVILYILLSGAPPFDISGGMEVVADAKIKFPGKRWSTVSAEAKDLVKQLLLADPKKRISVKDACSHKWLLVDDGDTHTHPLDDPTASCSRSGSNKCLFPHEDVVEDFLNLETEHTKAPKEPLPLESESSGSQRISDEKSGPRESAEITGREETTRVSNASLQYASDGVKEEAELKKVTDKKETLPMNVDETYQETIEAEQTPKTTTETLTETHGDTDDTSKKATEAEKSSETAVSYGLAAEAEETSADERDPLASLSLNSRGNEFRAIVARSIEESANLSGRNKQGKSSSSRPPQAVASSDSVPPKGKLVTPKSWEVALTAPSTMSSTKVAARSSRGKSTTKRTSKGNSRKSHNIPIVLAHTKPAELTDDEICSQFSDDGDSISSFPTSAAEGEDRKPAASDNGQKSTNTISNYYQTVQKKKRGPDADSTPTQPSKRQRMTFSSSTHATSSEPRAGTPISDEKKAASGSSAGGTPNGDKNEPSSRKSPGASQHKSKDGKQGGRQTKLSNWFRKKRVD